MTKPRRGGDVKKAPDGFLLPKEAKKRLGVTESVFRTMVSRGEIERITPPMRSEGYYRVTDINKLASRNTLFYLQNISTHHAIAEFSQATEDDIEGIFDAVASLWGAENTTPIEIHQMLYRANPYIDYVVKFRSLILGYINATPYIAETMQAILEGRKRGIDLKIKDVLAYEPGKSYDVYVGIVVRQDIPGHELYAERLMLGYFTELCRLAQQGITIRRMYAISDQEKSIRISRNLGFEEDPKNPGRFILDIETAKSPLIKKYRDVIHKTDQLPKQEVKQREISHDPLLEEMFQQIHDILIKSNIKDKNLITKAFMPITNTLAESPQMTIEQQVILRTIHEILARQLIKSVPTAGEQTHNYPPDLQRNDPDNP